MKKSELTLGKQVTYWTGAKWRTPEAVEIISLDPQPTRDPWGIRRENYLTSPNNVRVRNINGIGNGFVVSLRDLHPLELIAEKEKEEQARQKAQELREQKREAANNWLTDNNRKLREALEFRGAEVDWNSGGINIKLTLDQAKALLEKVTA
jgi:hypothetical protein